MSDTPAPAQAAEKAIREALAAGATSAIYTNPRDDNNWRANVLLACACEPDALSALLSQLAELRAEVERLRLNDARYRWLRERDWFNSDLCVLREPKRVLTRGIGLGADCPSHNRLDDAIDAALAADGKDGAHG